MSSSRQETEAERLDRNTIELVNELRVAGTGVQVLFAFLLVIPFDNRFTKLNSFERDVYFVTLACVAVAAVLLIAPSVHHRLLFRHGEKEFLVNLGSRLAVVAAFFLAISFTGIFVLIGDLLFGGTGAVLSGALMALLVALLWFAIPLARRERAQSDQAGSRSSG